MRMIAGRRGNWKEDWKEDLAKMLAGFLIGGLCIVGFGLLWKQLLDNAEARI